MFFKFKKSNISDQVIVTQKEKDGVILSFSTCLDDPEIYFGMSIIDSKYKNKDKYTKWDCLLFDRARLNKIIEFLKNPIKDENIYIKCTCYSEILEISEMDSAIYFNIWDNHFNRYKKLFKAEIVLSLDEANDLAKNLEDYIVKNVKD